MKILFLTHRFHPDVGGIEVNSELLADQFTRAGHEVRVVTWSDSPEADHFPYQIVRRPSIARLLSEHQWADVVYENNVCLRLAWPAAILRKPSVVAIRTWIKRTDGRIAFRDKLKQRWLARAKAVIAVSGAVRDKCWPEAVAIGNPYRVSLFKIRPEIDRDRDFVYLGRLVSDKGVELAIRALRELNDRLDPIARLTLTIIGDGPERETLERLTKNMGLTECVRFTGALRGDELVEELNRHLFMWVPSRWEEPFGNVALEGMACGCIPIVSDGGGLPEAVGSAGLIFMRGDLDDMVNQSRQLLVDRRLRNRLAIAANCHLEDHGPENVASRYLEVIEAAVASR